MNRKLIASLLVLCLAFSVGFAHAKPCEPKTFSNVSPATFECMKKKLQEYGIDVPQGYNGNLSGKGIAARFLYDGTSNLTIQIVVDENFDTQKKPKTTDYSIQQLHNSRPYIPPPALSQSALFSQ